MVDERYPTKQSYLGIHYVDGVVISIKDFVEVSKPFYQKGLSEFLGEKRQERTRPPLGNKIRLIDPSLHYLFQGTNEDKNAILDTGLFSQAVKPIINEIGSMAKPSEKIDASINKLYPLLDTLLIRNLIRFQFQNDTDIVIFPSVPITTISRLRFKKQMSKAYEMNRTSKVLFDTVFKATGKNRDSMSILTINMSVITSENIDNLMEVLAVGEPDHIGIRPLNLNEADIPRTRMLLELIRRTSAMTGGNVPIHLFNVTELGYISFCYGGKSMVSPIATDPYFKRRVEQLPPPRCGAYYHPIHMTHDPYDVFLEKTRPMNYRLPCHCEICNEYERVPNVPKEYWNKFRRIHFMLVKSMEMKELKDSVDSLKNALKDKFARSDRTHWLPFLD